MIGFHSWADAIAWALAEAGQGRRTRVRKIVVEGRSWWYAELK